MEHEGIPTERRIALFAGILSLPLGFVAMQELKAIEPGLGDGTLIACALVISLTIWAVALKLAGWFFRQRKGNRTDNS